MHKSFIAHNDKDLINLHVILRQMILIVLSYNYIGIRSSKLLKICFHLIKLNDKNIILNQINMLMVFEYYYTIILIITIE